MKDNNKKITTWILGIIIASLFIIISLILIKIGRPQKTGRDVVIFGDSIMAYATDTTSVANMVMRDTGLDVMDLSFGGTLMSCIYEVSTPAMQRNALSMYAISKSFLMDDFSLQRSYRATQPATDYFEDRISELEMLDLKKTDAVIIEQCLNDFTGGNPVGMISSDLEYTYCGALRKTIENIRAVNPDIRVIIVSPTKVWTRDGADELYTDYGGGTYEQFLYSQKKIAQELGAEYLSLYDVYDVPMETEEGLMLGSTYTVDGTHPNYYGRRVIAERISEYLRNG